MRVGNQRQAPAALLPGKKPGTHCTEAGRVDTRVGLGGWGKSRILNLISFKV
jgi:hypothetical protein